MSRWCVPTLLLVLASLLGCGCAWGYDRDKTDLVVLRNGDRISGDIVSLEYGILTLKTDNMSTLNIEWPAVHGSRSSIERTKLSIALRKVRRTRRV